MIRARETKQYIKNTKEYLMEMINWIGNEKSLLK